MCLHEFYHSRACGHHFPMVPPSAKPKECFKDCKDKRDNTIAVPQSHTCDAVKLALKFYHDQVVYLPADMHCGGKVEIPKSCPIVHTPSGEYPRGFNKWKHEDFKRILKNEMLCNGLGPVQKAQIQHDAAVLDRCSNRSKPNEHIPADLRRHKECPYPWNMYSHVQNLKRYQQRETRFQMPNVRYHHVKFGCGGPFSAECLTGWDGIGLLTHRLHLWADSTTHPRPCNDECLAGWSGEALGADLGADLRAHRTQTWAGDRRSNYRNLDYAGLTQHVLGGVDHWVEIDYSNISHLHADQFSWNGVHSVRIHHSPTNDTVYIPEKVWVPVPESLDQVLRALRPVQPPRSPPPLSSSPSADPGSPTHASSTENLLERLPEAFDEERPLSARSPAPPRTMSDDSPSSSGSGVSTESGSVSTLVEEETPEEAEARRQRARTALREKIARDFPGRLGTGGQ